MQKMKKLPDAEFEIMKTVWASEPPVTTNMIMQNLGNDKEWLIQTVVTLMARLVERGFLRSEKHGKERLYFPLISREEYLNFETGNFIRQYHGDSFSHLVKTLNENKTLTDEDIDELYEFIKERKN